MSIHIRLGTLSGSWIRASTFFSAHCWTMWFSSNEKIWHKPNESRHNEILETFIIHLSRLVSTACPYVRGATFNCVREAIRIVCLKVELPAPLHRANEKVIFITVSSLQVISIFLNGRHQQTRPQIETGELFICRFWTHSLICATRHCFLRATLSIDDVKTEELTQVAADLQNARESYADIHFHDDAVTCGKDVHVRTNEDERWALGMCIRNNSVEISVRPSNNTKPIDDTNRMHSIFTVHFSFSWFSSFSPLRSVVGKMRAIAAQRKYLLLS